MSDYRIVMDTSPKPHEGARPAVRKESVEGVLKELRVKLTLFVGFSPVGGCEPHKSCGVWYGMRDGKDLNLGRRKMLSFTADSKMAKCMTGYEFPDGTTLCICAAHSTWKAYCVCKDFFVCVWDTQENKEGHSAHIYSVFRREINQDGSSVIKGFWHPDDLHELIRYLTEHNRAREAAREARLQCGVK